jgi:hypothetical protein
MSIENILDRLHGKVVADPRLQIFTSALRLLLAFGFIPPSIPKILHKPFTMLPETNPVGAYFAALYRTGFYYEFIGWSQIAAALLLLYPRTSHLGALMFLPIILNIAVLTNSVGFQGTWLVTIMMSLAALYLVCWDYDRWKYVIWARSTNGPRVLKNEFLLLPVIFAAGGAGAAALAFALNLANLRSASWVPFAALSAAGAVFGLLTAIHHRLMRVGGVRNV